MEGWDSEPLPQLPTSCWHGQARVGVRRGVCSNHFSRSHARAISGGARPFEVGLAPGRWEWELVEVQPLGNLECHARATARLRTL